ncbi:MAG: protein arginine kinase [Verrucomicrobia bacterium]|nr:protein arginine kinase [Verrucomicrobiota bacterium]
MRFSAFISGPVAARPAGTHHDIVISSRVRLARNVKAHPFPGWARKADRLAVLEVVKPAVEALPQMEDAFSEYLQDLSATEKQILVERHLISREHAAKSGGSAVVMNREQTLSIMINEEDHLRMQAIQPGFQLKTVFKSIDEVDTRLEEKLDYAFSEKLGYLTACLTNVGTGMRASAMLHLPALVLDDKVNQVIQAVNKIGLAVRGLYGEGSEAMGNLFQISNQTTLGEREEDILGRLNKVIEQIIEHELNARAALLQRKTVTLLDQVGRAFGILRHAHSITSKEALNLLSFIRLGIDLGSFPTGHRQQIDDLFTETQPAHLQRTSPTKLQAEDRDALRAETIRRKLADLPAPEPPRAAS